MSESRRRGHSDRKRSRSPNESSHSNHDDRDKRPRDGSRGHKDRVRGAGKEHDRGTESSRSKHRIEREKEREEVSRTVIIKGLPSHTTEPTETGDCKGFAFVLFPSVEHAQFFMTAFAGSAGDPNAPQFIIGNRAVTLEYAKDEKREKERDKESRSDRGAGSERSERSERVSRGDRDRDREQQEGGGGSRSDPRDRDMKLKNDWLCDKCQGHNFARRAECYRCSVPRGDNVTYVGSNGTLCVPDVFTDGAVGCDIPGPFLAVRGFGPYVSENSIVDLFRQFAQVKNVKILRDQMTGMSKGLAYVEFYTTEHAVHTVQQTLLGQVHLDSSPLKILFAKESFRIAILIKESEAQKFHHHQSAKAQSQTPLLQASSLPSLSIAPHMTAESIQSAKWPSAPSYNKVQGHPQVQSVQAINKGIIVQGATKIKPIWPPSFDTDGGAYIFQSQSGSFLEPKSQFFYCPKSKLYYSCTDGIYYNCVVLQGDISFVRFNPALPLEPEGTSVPPDSTAKSTQATVDSAAAAALIRKPVILSMGLGMKNKNSTVKINNISKKIAGDMLKWGSIQDNEEGSKEVKETDKGQMILLGASKGKGKAAIINPINTPTTLSDHTVNPNSNFENQVTDSMETLSRINPSNRPMSPSSSTVATGKRVAPVPSSSSASSEPNEVVACLLCRRQFATLEQLGRHERESKLHKENMMLMVAAASNDIAKQLAAFGSSATTVITTNAAAAADDSAVTTSIPPHILPESTAPSAPPMLAFSLPSNITPTSANSLPFSPPPPPPYSSFNYPHPLSSSSTSSPPPALPIPLSSISSTQSSAQSHCASDPNHNLNYRENSRESSGSHEASSSSQYRDRALERKATHHQSFQSESIHRERERQWNRARDEDITGGGDNNRERNMAYAHKNQIDNKSVHNPPLSDQHNPGTQMLRKMGWNEGQGLGRSGGGSEESVGVRIAEEMNSNGGSRGAGRRVTGIGGNNGTGIPQVDYRGSGKEYKDSLMRAAKARYDQVTNQ